MKRRFAASAVLLLGSLLALAGFAVTGRGTAQTPPRIAFVLATGSTDGTYFPVGEAIAGIVSHPPGASRCDGPDACGPAGLMASVRTSAGAIANVRDVNAGRADAGLAQSDVVAEAAAGRGAFRKDGPQAHIRVIANLYPEDVHVVAAAGAHIASIADLRGKRVSLGAPDSGTIATARAVLAACRVPQTRLKASYDPVEIAARRLERGEIDAFFFVGGAPVELVRGLMASGRAVLVPIDGAARLRLLTVSSGLAADTIPSDAYPGLHAPLDTVSVRAVLIVNDAEPPGLVYGITRALFSPVNRNALDDAHPIAHLIRLDTAATSPPAPLHPGAARFYRAMGVGPARVAHRS